MITNVKSYKNFNRANWGSKWKLDHVNMSLTRVYRKLLPENPAPMKSKDLPNLLLKDEEAFYAFEKFLRNDDNFLATVCFLIYIQRILCCHWPFLAISFISN